MSLTFLFERMRRRLRPAVPPAYTLRAARRGDAAAMQRFVDGLSPTSRRQRFHGALARCSAARAECLVSSDGVRQSVVVAVEAGSAALVGEARWARDGEASAQAELAIAVAEGWQGRGLADALMAAVLVNAAAAGISCLVADVLADNGRVRGFLHRHAFACTADAGGILHLQRALGPADAASAALRPWRSPPVPHCGWPGGRLPGLAGRA